MITKERAQEIASYWHGGQWTSLYSFCSSGYINFSDLVSEINRCRFLASDKTSALELLDLTLYLLGEVTNDLH